MVLFSSISVTMYTVVKVFVFKIPFSDEFDIIPSVKPENKSYSFVLDETKLGIFSWCVKDLFCYVYAELTVARKCKRAATENEGAVSTERVNIFCAASFYIVAREESASSLFVSFKHCRYLK